MGTQVEEFVESQKDKLRKYVKPGKELTFPRSTYYSQRDNYTMPHRTCNSSANAMYLDWVRRATGLEGLGGDNAYLKKVLEYGDTIYHENQTAALKWYGYSTKWMTDGNFELVFGLLKAGIPVVVNILHRGSESAPRGGHIIMLVGLTDNDKTVLCQDPYGTLKSDYVDTDGRLDTIKVSTFKRRWQGGYRVLA